MIEKPGTSLWKSITGDKLTDLFGMATDVALNAATSGALDGVPVVGLLTAMARTGRSARDQLYLRKVIEFLHNLNTTSQEKRDAFIASLADQDELERFGDAIILILEQNDDLRKPGIIGRVVAAHIDGHIEYAKAMRLVNIVNRAYACDLPYLKTFKSGVQAHSPDIAASLFSAGLLANAGMDGGTFDQDGGLLYEMNEYGRLLVQYGLN
ncbi:hypothetical protein [Paracraurococcus lichenis]|uniref:DUF4393 domain-containing protein n=1 Tax=Paracraurococcus lichenis TaxID=3064888 RepID=A0ABT9E8E0_9PROT|nr:hypothetical protein [Paracraurococcus sp. LOR1-02]MDO9712481.1 hypothetical protein [Paracraurococcus sp. LOR1-02]